MIPPEPFELPDDVGKIHAAPADRPTFLVFVKEDCATCNLVLPMVQVLHQATGETVDVTVVSQVGSDIPILRDRHDLTMLILDDSELDVSYDAALETVPSAFLFDETGECVAQTYGFLKSEWMELISAAEQLGGTDAIPLDWDNLPALKPGCGAKNVEPGILERLEARRSGKIQGHLIEIPTGVDVHEFLFELGVTDGLPVVPPTPELVWSMLQGTQRDSQEIVANVATSRAACTVEKAAVNAVMAGARPEFLPVILAGLEAVTVEDFNLHGIVCTLGAQAPVYVVNGPIRNVIGMNGGINVLGQGNRANAAIGRSLQLIVRNVGGGKPGDEDRAAFGGPHKYTCCFPENEEASPWPPLHVERGFDADQSTVTVFPLEAPRAILDQYSTAAEQLANNIAWSLTSVTNSRMFNYGELLLALSPQHAGVIANSGWSKDDLRSYLVEATKKPLSTLLADRQCGEGMDKHRYPMIDRVVGEPPDDPDQLVSKLSSKEMLNIVVTGGDASPFSMLFGGWGFFVPLPAGNRSVTVEVVT